MPLILRQKQQQDSTPSEQSHQNMECLRTHNSPSLPRICRIDRTLSIISLGNLRCTHTPRSRRSRQQLRARLITGCCACTPTDILLHEAQIPSLLVVGTKQATRLREQIVRMLNHLAHNICKPTDREKRRTTSPATHAHPRKQTTRSNYFRIAALKAAHASGIEQLPRDALTQQSQTLSGMDHINFHPLLDARLNVQNAKHEHGHNFISTLEWKNPRDVHKSLPNKLLLSLSSEQFPPRTIST